MGFIQSATIVLNKSRINKRNGYSTGAAYERSITGSDNGQTATQDVVKDRVKNTDCITSCTVIL